MRTGWLVLALVSAGCSGKGKDADTAGEPSCDGLTTNVLGQVEVTQWPAGLSDVLVPYDGLEGRYQVSSTCGGLVTIKIVAVPREELQVVTSPYAAGSSGCGCTFDPDYGDDAQYPMGAITETFDFYVDSYEDPALDGQTLHGQGVLYGTSAPFLFRGCALDDVDPVLQSAYDQVGGIVRITDAGELEGAIILRPLNGEAEVCELGGFDKVE
ncbi:MAG: hypothetical protein R3F59_16370 [Myxococcota bacterium]